MATRSSAVVALSVCAVALLYFATPTACLNASSVSDQGATPQPSAETAEGPDEQAAPLNESDSSEDSKTTILFSGFYTAPPDGSEDEEETEEAKPTTTDPPERESEEDWTSYHDLELEKYRAGRRHPCLRKCSDDGRPMLCRYHFRVERYQAMSKACYDCPMNLSDCYRPDCIPADGVKRPVIAVNRSIPGPSIEVCLGDVVIVDLENAMTEDTVSLHWHGHVQQGSPYMDGVPYVTQCPILPGTTFRYKYLASSHGTHFWHSHTGTQRGDGVFGAFVVRVPNSRNPHRDLYDRDLPEHTIQVLDWSHAAGVALFTAHHHSDGTNKPPTLQVNGKGIYQSFFANDTQSEVYTPPASFTVVKGLRYRLRLINAGVLNCPIQMSIDNHTLTVISADGIDITPVTVDSLVSYAGERWDLVLEADQEVDNYWVRFRGLMDCDERFTEAHQVAVLRYIGSDPAQNPQGEVSYRAATEIHKEGTVLNELNVPLNDTRSISMPELSVIERIDDPSIQEPVTKQIVMSFDFYPIDNLNFHKPGLYGYAQINDGKNKVMTPQLNHVSLKLPPFPLMSQHGELRPDMLCNASALHNCTQNYCECTNIIELQMGEIVELILIDIGEAYYANHPFHLHGHKFRVVAMDRLGESTSVEQVLELDRKGLIQRNLRDPPVKDTVTVPDGGYTIIRFRAANPGYWLFHCHLEFHAEIGMAVVFKTGEASQFPRVPRGFPRCGNYLPDPAIDEKDLSRSPVYVVLGQDSEDQKVTHWWNSGAHSHRVTLLWAILPAVLCALLSA